MSHESKTAAHLEDDVLAHFQEASTLQAGHYAAINWGDLASKVKEAVKVVAPIIQTFTPPQYQAILALIIKLVGTPADPAA